MPVNRRLNPGLVGAGVSPGDSAVPAAAAFGAGADGRQRGELTAWPVIEERTGARFYFALPYCASERMLNENTNGRLRQCLPKRASMASLTQQYCHRLARQLNQRPRKRLGYQTPAECYEG